MTRVGPEALSMSQRSGYDCHSRFRKMEHWFLFGIVEGVIQMGSVLTSGINFG